MSPFNGLMNHVAALSHSEIYFTRHVSTRIATVFGGIPLEILATIQNIVTLPFQPIGLACKVIVKAFNLCINSQTLRDFEDLLPGLRQIVVTAYKIFAYAIGTVFTGVLGLASPMSNFGLHCFLGLVHDEQAEADRIQTEEEEGRQRESQEAMMQAQIQTMLFAMRQKAAEQERLRAEEAQKEREAQLAMSKLAKAEENKKQISLNERFILDNLNKRQALPVSQNEQNAPPAPQQTVEKLVEEANRVSNEGNLKNESKKGLLGRIGEIFTRLRPRWI